MFFPLVKCVTNTALLGRATVAKVWTYPGSRCDTPSRGQRSRRRGKQLPTHCFQYNYYPDYSSDWPFHCISGPRRPPPPTPPPPPVGVSRCPTRRAPQRPKKSRAPLRPTKVRPDPLIALGESSGIAHNIAAAVAQACPEGQHFLLAMHGPVHVGRIF